MPTIKPYILIPILIEQPTWGGSYIVQTKRWSDKPYLKTRKIGQSYELSKDSKISLTLTNSDDPRFEPDLRLSSGKQTVSSLQSLSLEDLVQLNPLHVLGPKIAHTYQSMPLCVKFTQALGNSFQLHIRADTVSSRWTHKPESWYFFEKGKITAGIRNSRDVHAFKTVCVQIDNAMTELSKSVRSKKISHEDAMNEAKKMIKKLNPWQFIQEFTVDPNTIVELSSGGIHHSWEEDVQTIPQGNILYEVQVDVADEKCSVRCFDQGKIQKDGSIRPVHIEDYFTHLDTSEEHNDPKNLIRKKTANTLFDTRHYTTDEITVSKKISETTDNSFVHLFVRNGSIHIKTKTDTIRLTKGHSAFIPWIVHMYDLIPETPNATVLKTYIRSL